MRWQTFDLGDLVDVYDGPHATPKTTDRGPIFLGIDALARGRLNLESTRHVSEADYVTWTRRITPTAGDVVFSYETRLGEAALIPDGLVCCLGRRMGLMRAKAGKVDAHFLLYRYLAPDYQAFLATRTIHGATVDRLPLKQFPSFPISAPPIAEQRALAKPLRLLDHKIELNRRINETLEATAQAIFRDWFVDFGPVRRKLTGATDPVEIMGGVTADPVRAAELAGLFPAALTDAGIPNGWTGTPLRNLADQMKGVADPLQRPDELFEHYSLPAYDAGQSPITEQGLSIKSNKTPVAADSVLLSKLNPEISRVWLPNDPSGVTQVASTEFLIFRPKPGIGRGLLYFMFKDRGVRQTLEGMVTGTSKSHQRISPPALLSVETVIGASQVFEAFETFATPILMRVLALRAENHTLAETRDYLLPRLMSGEVRISEAQKLAEAAA